MLMITKLDNVCYNSSLLVSFLPLWVPSVNPCPPKMTDPEVCSFRQTQPSRTISAIIVLVEELLSLLASELVGSSLSLFSVQRMTGSEAFFTRRVDPITPCVSIFKCLCYWQSTANNSHLLRACTSVNIAPQTSDWPGAFLHSGTRQLFYFMEIFPLTYNYPMANINL